MTQDLDLDTERRALALLRELLASEAPDPEPLLERLDSEQPAIAVQLRRLLEAHAAQTDRLQGPFRLQASAPPERLGGYRLREVIGRGGMGAVALAEREQGGFTQTVALKWIPPELLDAQRRERFRLEREVAARLNHPHIARLLDGGEGPNGEAWYAMELVEGSDVASHARERALDLGTRVGLVLDLCAAVSHAHAHLVLHRDIKPANVLVDGEGRLKLIDFGIAKALDGRDPALTVDSLPMTPRYAAPEQLRGEPPTTASDQWQVAALAFELLCGSPLRQGNAGDLPSLRAAQADPAHLQGIGLDARTLSARLRGDLDAILGMALSDLPEQRYASVAALAADLQAWRSGGAVEARRHERWHAALRFARRQRWALLGAAGAAASLALAAGLWMQGLKAEADSARRNAQAIQRLFLQTDGSAPLPSLDLAGFFSHVVDAAIAEHALPDSERQRLLLTLASTSREAGANPAAERAAQEALRLVEVIGQQGQALEVEALDLAARMAISNRGAEAFEEADALLARSAELHARQPEGDVEAKLLHLNTRMQLARRRGDAALHLELAGQAVALAEARDASLSSRTYQRQLQAGALVSNRRFSEASDAIGQLLDMAEASDDPALISSLPMLRTQACELDTLAAAPVALRRCTAALEGLEATGQLGSRAGAQVLLNLSVLQGQDDDPHQALETVQRAAAALNAVESEETVSMGRLGIWRQHADLLARLDRHAEAAELRRRALNGAESLTGPDFPWSLAVRLELAESLQALGQVAEVRALLAPGRQTERLSEAQQARWRELADAAEGIAGAGGQP